MKIIALERQVEGAAAKDFAPHLRAEASRVWEMHLDGVIRELYFRADRTDAVLILECEDTAEANDVLGTLPLVKEGLIAFDLIPLVPYSGFSRLFEPTP